MKRYSIQVHVRKIIKMMTVSLYSCPDVFLREMIQNACDGIHKRMLLARGVPFNGRILISADPEAGTLTISDNGAGLEEDEIRENLSTIGGSDKEQLNAEIDRLEAQGEDHFFKMIGQFGVGLYSCFIVADRVRLTTRAASGKAWLWENKGDLEYFLQLGEREEQGTTAVLFLKDEHRRYLDETRLIDIVRNYADIIGVPIHVNGSVAPANRIEAPWHGRGQDGWQRQEELWKNFWDEGRNPRSLDLFPVDQEFDFVDAETDKPAKGRVYGLLSVRQSGTLFREHGRLRVFVRRMMVNAGVKNLLPSWAGFIDGVIECDALQPSTSREDLVANGVLATLRELLGIHVMKRLLAIARDDHDLLLQVMRTHGHNFLNICEDPKHDKLLVCATDLYLFDSLWGEQTLADYLAKAKWGDQGKPVLYYSTEKGNHPQIEMLCKSRRINAFLLHRDWEKNLFLKCVKKFGTQVDVKKLDEAGSDLFDEVAAEEGERFAGLLREFTTEFATESIAFEVRKFSPPAMPAIYCRPAPSARKDLDSLDLDETEQKLATILRAVRQQRPTLVLNAANPLMQTLVSRPAADVEKRKLIMRCVLGNALLLHSQRLQESTLEQIFANNNVLMGLFLGASAGTGTDRQEDEPRENDSSGRPPVGRFIQ